MEQFFSDPLAFWDILEIAFGFLLGIASRIKLLKPRDLTILLQVVILGVRVLRWMTKNHHPMKRSNRAGVDEDLTKMHEQIMKEHNLADKKEES